MTQQLFAYRPDLQGLRAVAVILVILAHSGLEIIPGGFVGVDIFFVLSGYLITALLLREQALTGRIDFSAFYARRLKRLLPALMCMLCAMFVAAAWILSGYEAGKQLASGPYAAVWISNLHFVSGSIDYFDELSGLDFFLHTWSLGVEEQFYLVWPIVLVWLNGLALRNKRGRVLIAGITGLCLASFLLSIYWMYTAPQWSFYLMPARIWQFGFGALVYLAEDSPVTKQFLQRTNIAGKLRATGLVLIAGSGLGLHENLFYPGFWALLPSAGAALVIAGQADTGMVRQLLTSRGMVWLGDRSYSLYLWHWPVLITGFSLGLRGQLVFTLYLLLLVLLLSIVSYRYVEIPFWKGRAASLPPRIILWAGLFIMLVVIAVFEFSLRQFPQNPPPKSPRSDLPVIYSMKCDAWFFNARVEPCLFGSNKAQKTVVFVGDSHGGQWFSFIPEIYKQPDWRVIALTKSACPMVDQDYYYATIKQLYTTCSEWRNAVLDELDRIKPDLVIVGSASTYEFTDQEWIEGSARIFSRLSSAAEQVIVIAGTPLLGFDGPGCVERNQGSQLQACTSTEGLERAAMVSGLLLQSMANLANVTLLDLNDLVCPSGRCNAVSADGVIVYRDSQHLTDTFVRAQIPEIQRRIMQ